MRRLLATLAATAVALATPGAGALGEEPEEARLGDDTPIVLIVLDELPTASLMTRDGQRIDRNRFPNIAGFASGATWYRDNATAGDFTAWAVPSIFSGRMGDQYTLPVTASYPDNIFTLLGPGRRVHVLEPLTELCPVAICPDGSQGGAPDATDAVEFIKTKFEPFDPAEVGEWINNIPSGGGTLSVVHLESPHLPLRFTPDGRTYPGGPLVMPTNLLVNPWTTGESAVAFVQQRHLLQAGYSDRLVGKILRRVKSDGDFDRALIVLTADHGVSFDPKDLRRDATGTNIGATLNPPLIIKYPQQQGREVSTASTQTLDILPTIAKTVGANIPTTEGVPVDEIPPGRILTASRHYQAPLDFTVGQIRSDRRQVLRDQYRRLGSRKLWKLGPRSGLIGRRARGKRVLAGARVKFDQPGQIRQADSSRRSVPSLVSAVLTGVPRNRVLALSWNGRIVATTRTFGYRHRTRAGWMVPPSVMKRGRNRLAVFSVASGNALRRVRKG